MKSQYAMSDILLREALFDRAHAADLPDVPPISHWPSRSARVVPPHMALLRSGEEMVLRRGWQLLEVGQSDDVHGLAQIQVVVGQLR